MAYVNRDFKTQKALREAVKAGEEVYVERSYLTGQLPLYNGNQAAIEGPKYSTHAWYAAVTVDPETGRVLKVNR